jgi:hypothetical protein
MAVLGHRTLAEAQRYTMEANRSRMAASAMAELGQIGNEKPSTLLPRRCKLHLNRLI